MYTYIKALHVITLPVNYTDTQVRAYKCYFNVLKLFVILNTFAFVE